MSALEELNQFLSEERRAFINLRERLKGDDWHRCDGYLKCIAVLRKKLRTLIAKPNRFLNPEP